MNLLENTTTYLAAPIDRVSDHGIPIRQEIAQKINKFGIKVFDPTNKPGKLISETKEEKGKAQQLKDEEKWQELREYAKIIRKVDLRLVDLSNFLIVYVDPDVHMVGTWEEVITAERQRKPIFLIVKGGKKRLSLWCFAIVEPQFIFDSVDECIAYIEKLNNGEIPLDDRWILI